MLGINAFYHTHAPVGRCRGTHGDSEKSNTQCLCVSVDKLLGDNAMQSFAHRDNVHNAHIAQIGFSGDVALQPGSQRLAEEIPEDGKPNGKGDQQEAPKVGPRLLHGDKGKRRRQQRGRGDVGAASLVNGELTFSGAQAPHRFGRRFHDVIFIEVTHQVEAGRVGMSTHGLIFEFTGKDVECCVFNRVVSSGFK